MVRLSSRLNVERFSLLPPSSNIKPKIHIDIIGISIDVDVDTHMSGIRNAYPAPKHPESDSHSTIPTLPRLVIFRHPGYEDDKNILLCLPALDKGTTLHCATALAACSVLSNNRNDGYLTEDKVGLRKVEMGLDQGQERDTYYFHVPGASDYAIVPSFDDWKFPHHDLPAIWQQCEISQKVTHGWHSSTTVAVTTRDDTCRITLHLEGTQVAHLIPVAQREWFTLNGMSRYTLEGPHIGDVSNQGNAILLRSDVRSIFDAKQFTIVPKRTTTTEAPNTKPVLVIHAFERLPVHEVVRLYHNVRVQPLTGVAVEFLYARFAYCIFQHFERRSFLIMGVPRRLGVRVEGGFVEKMFTADECRDMARGSRSRSRSGSSFQTDSPRKKKKRRRKEEEEEEEEEEAQDVIEYEYECEHEYRGGKRRRFFSSPKVFFSSPH